MKAKHARYVARQWRRQDVDQHYTVYCHGNKSTALTLTDRWRACTFTHLRLSVCLCTRKLSSIRNYQRDLKLPTSSLFFRGRGNNVGGFGGGETGRESHASSLKQCLPYSERFSSLADTAFRDTQVHFISSSIKDFWSHTLTSSLMLHCRTA